MSYIPRGSEDSKHAHLKGCDFVEIGSNFGQMVFLMQPMTQSESVVGLSPSQMTEPRWLLLLLSHCIQP